MIKRITHEILSLFSIKGAILIFYGLPLAIFIRMISKLVLVRIMKINSERIGELIINPAIYLYQKENKINMNGRFHIDIFFMKTKPINTQLSNMLHRKIVILPKIIMNPIFEAQNKLNFIFKNSEKYYPIKQREYKFHYIDKLPYSKKNIEFLEKEIERGKEEIFNKFGVKKTDKYVCLLIRDQEFLKKIYPNDNFDFHEYRNIEPSIFMNAAETLSKLGYYVFRMGKYTNKKVNTFVSVFPYSKPKFTLLVLLDEPEANQEYIYTFRDGTNFKYKGNNRNTAGWTSVEIAGKIIEKIGPILATKY